MAAAAGGDDRAADHHFEQALELSDRLQHRVGQARVRYWWARTLRRRQGADVEQRATSLLYEAAVIADDFGLAGLRAMVDEELAALG